METLTNSMYRTKLHVRVSHALLQAAECEWRLGRATSVALAVRRASAQSICVESGRTEVAERPL